LGKEYPDYRFDLGLRDDLKCVTHSPVYPPLVENKKFRH